MKAAEPASPSSALRAALLDYFEAPGKYQLTLRQPALLFASIREILQVASGRGEPGAREGARLRDAANFFIRAALLYPGADHYAVLGLASGEVPPDLKERYRLLMRMIHPDFAQGSTAWPADAATRVNRAYEVLSSAVQQREYDEQLAALRLQRPVAASAGPALQAAASRRFEGGHPRIGKKAAVAIVLAVGVPAVLLLLPRSEPDQLVQRAAPAARLDEVAQVETDLAARSTPALVSSPQLPRAVEPAAAPVTPAAVAVTAPVTPPSLPAPPLAAPPPQRPSVTAAPAPVATAVTIVSPKPVPRAPAPPIAPLQAVPPAAVAPPVEAARPIPLAVADAPVRAAPVPAVTVVPPSFPAPVAVPTPIPVMTVAAVTTASPSAVAVGKLTATLAMPVLPAPTLADAQPLLTQVLQMLESGSGDQLLRLLDGDARRQPGAVALSRQYEQLVKGARPVHLSQVEFAGESREGGVLLVTGRIRLHAGEPTIGSFGQKLLLRAEFAQRGGKVQLTGLSGSAD